jgi:hypothetical protein
MCIKRYYIIGVIFFILLCTGNYSSIYADNIKYISLKHIGDQDSIIPIIIINTFKDGFERAINNPYLLEKYVFEKSFFADLEYYIVKESTFDEIIHLINDNIKLFTDIFYLIPDSTFGIFRIHIKNNDEEYYYYLNERKSSAIFYVKLYKLIKEKNENIMLLKELELSFKYYYFSEFIQDIGNPLN